MEKIGQNLVLSLANKEQTLYDERVFEENHIETQK